MSPSRPVDLLAVLFVREQVGLDGATRFDRAGGEQVSARGNLTKGGRAEGFQGSLMCFFVLTGNDDGVQNR